MARHIMESWGCIVEIAENGAIAIDYVMEKDFDLILMDIQMPVMDGIEATKNIRGLKDEHKSSIPIVALTANALRGNSEVYIDAGMNDCLAKPFEEPALFETVYKNIKKDKSPVMNIPSEIIEEETVPAAPANVKLYDLSMVEIISGGDRSFVVKMLQLFLDTIPVSLKEIRSAADSGEWLALSKLAHKLKSTIDSMGIIELKQDIRFIETHGKAGHHLGEMPALVDKVVNVMEQVMQHVRKDHSL